MANPKIHPAILLSPVENGYVAYDPASDKLHQLNPMAALLAELSDGTRSVEEIQNLSCGLCCRRIARMRSSAGSTKE
jgi:hypothetical protein